MSLAPGGTDGPTTQTSFGDLSAYVDAPSTITTGATRADGVLATQWGPFTSASGTPLLVTDSTIAASSAIRVRAADTLLSSSGSDAAFLATGECTIILVCRYRSNGTSTKPIVLDTTEAGTQKGVQLQFGDLVGDIFYGRDIFVRQWNGTTWFDSSSTTTNPGTFIALKWQVVVIRLTSTNLDIRVDGQFVWPTGFAITKPYLTGPFGRLSIGGGAFDYKAIELYSRRLSDVECATAETRLIQRFNLPTPAALTLAGDPTMLGGPTVSASFPFISALGNGHIYVTAYMGIDGVQVTDKNQSYRSTDNGTTWDVPVVETTNISSLRYSDLKTSEPLTNASILQVAFTYDGSNNPKSGISVRTSTDNTATWSSWGTANPGAPTWTTVQGAPVEGPTLAGHVHMPVVTQEGALDTFFKVWDYQSTDFGATWPTRVLIADGVADSKKYAEAGFWTLPSGEIRCLIRDDTVTGGTPMLQTHSTDNGATWAATAATNLSAFSPGQQVRVVTIGGVSGYEVWIGREIGSSNKGAIYYRGPNAAWNAPWNASIIEIDPTWGGFYYAGCYETSPGRLLLIYAASVNNGNDNNVRVRVFDTWLLTFAMPGTVTPSSASMTVSTTQQLTITGAGDYSYSVSGTSGGNCTSGGLYTAGIANGTDTVTVHDVNGATVGTFTATVSGATNNPVVTAIWPDMGIAGHAVLITGSHFTGATSVTIGGVACTSVVVVDDSNITAVVGAHAEGTGTGFDVVVTASGTGTLTAGFFYLHTSLVRHYDPAYTSSVHITGGFITQLDDLCGNENLLQSGAGHQPTVAATGINSHPAVHYAAGQGLAGGTVSVATSAITEAALFSTSDVTDQSVIGMQYNTQHSLLMIEGATTGKLAYVTAANTRAKSDVVVNNGSPHAGLATINTAGDQTARVYLDGTTAGATTAASAIAINANDQGDRNCLGESAQDQTGLDVFMGFRGNIAVGLRFNTALTGTSITNTMAALKHRGGIP